MEKFTEKYRPKSLLEIRGNDKSIGIFSEWASNWSFGSPAVIIHGNPGVGKTSAAHALAFDMGWNLIELNASDKRTANEINRIALHAAESGTFDAGVSGRQLIVLDEADNLHGTYDRGGTAALTKLVKKSHQPLILIANDYYGMSRPLRNACSEIRFNDISPRSILPVLRDICRKENINAGTGALEKLAEKNSGDLRGALNDLQAVVSPNETLHSQQIVTSSRNHEENIFSFLNDLLKNLTPHEAIKSSYNVNETPDNLLSWIDENASNDFNIDELSGVYDSLSRADIWLTRTQITQNYSYWRYARDIMVAGTAASRSSPSNNGWTRYGPPRYWQKLGASRASRDLRDSIAQSIAKLSKISMSSARLGVLPILKIMVLNCQNKILTTSAAAAYDLDLKSISYLTGSGKTTKKVKKILDDSTVLRGKTTSIIDPISVSKNNNSTNQITKYANSSTKASPDTSSKAKNPQSGLSDFL